jgi:hypothetical protein
MQQDTAVCEMLRKPSVCMEMCLESVYWLSHSVFCDYLAGGLATCRLALLRRAWCQILRCRIRIYTAEWKTCFSVVTRIFGHQHIFADFIENQLYCAYVLVSCRVRPARICRGRIDTRILYVCYLSGRTIFDDRAVYLSLSNEGKNMGTLVLKHSFVYVITVFVFLESSAQLWKCYYYYYYVFRPIK